jgi:hypothetical protein
MFRLMLYFYEDKFAHQHVVSDKYPDARNASHLTPKMPLRFRPFPAAHDNGGLRPLSGSHDVVSYGWVGPQAADHLPIG